MILSFKAAFVSAVVAGTKPHTIRAGRRWRVGMGIQFYEGSYHQKRNKFRENAVAIVVQVVQIELRKSDPPNKVAAHYALLIDGRQLNQLECDQLAVRDGFPTSEEFFQFFDNTHGFPFTGQLIGWTDLRY